MLGRGYYGWWVLAVLMAGAFLASGASALFMGAMLKPMSSDLGWSRTTTSTAITLSTFAAAAVTPFLGRLADRHSPRLLAPLGGLGVALGFALIGLTQQLWLFYAGYGIARALGPSGIGTVFPMKTLTHWFVGRRGRAFGLLAMMLPLGGSILAPVAQSVVDDLSWRAVFFALAGALVLLFVIPSALIVRRQPADLGLEVEGSAIAPQPGADRPVEVNWTLAQALRSKALWFVMSSLVLSSLAIGALTYHQVAYFTDIGISTRFAILALSAYGFTGALSSGVWGLLVERYSERLLSTLTLIASALAVLLLLAVTTGPQALVFGVAFGLSARGGGALIMLMLVQYFGKTFYGSISGLVSTMQTVGLGGGPLMAAVAFDLTGSYELIFVVFAAMLLFSAALMWLARQPALPADGSLDAVSAETA